VEQERGRGGNAEFVIYISPIHKLFGRGKTSNGQFETGLL
jgi:hypothetical protein